MAVIDAAWRPSRALAQRSRSSSSRATPTASPVPMLAPRIRSGGSTPEPLEDRGREVDRRRRARRGASTPSAGCRAAVADRERGLAQVAAERLPEAPARRRAGSWTTSSSSPARGSRASSDSCARPAGPSGRETTTSACVRASVRARARACRSRRSRCPRRGRARLPPRSPARSGRTARGDERRAPGHGAGRAARAAASATRRARASRNGCQFAKRARRGVEAQVVVLVVAVLVDVRVQAASAGACPGRCPAAPADACRPPCEELHSPVRSAGAAPRKRSSESRGGSDALRRVDEDVVRLCGVEREDRPALLVAAAASAGRSAARRRPARTRRGRCDAGSSQTTLAGSLRDRSRRPACDRAAYSRRPRLCSDAASRRPSPRDGCSVAVT